MTKRVIILGGGVAGMSAAHELIERGFEVEVYDKHRLYAGGKARSVPVPGSNKPPLHKSPTDQKEPATEHLHLPAEHGFRFFPGFYKHVIDTMKRIPYKNQQQGVFENLVPVRRVGIFRADKKPIETIVNFPQSFADIHELINSMHSDTGLTSAEKKFFAAKLWQLMTTCYDRRLNEYEKIGWWQYLEADRFSSTYKALLVQGITRTLVAANAKKASTKTGGDIFLQLLFNMSNPGVQTDRVLNGPTNDVWIDPWLAYLRSKGVKYIQNRFAEKIEMTDSKISGIWIAGYKNGVREETKVTGDYYILATPVEVTAKLLSEDVLKADPSLETILNLAPSVAWMNGIQFYLSEKIDIVHGHCIYADSPWALTSISQLNFWKDYDMKNRYNGKVQTILSVDVSDWETLGTLEDTCKLKGAQCTYGQIKNEVWAQLKRSLNVEGKTILRDDMIVKWHIDNDITVGHEHNSEETGHQNGKNHYEDKTHREDKNKEPLLVNTTNSWALRPEAYTYIPNLFLASDYVRTYTDLATMEGANEAARRAVNAIIEASGVNAPHCKIWPLHEPDLLEPMRKRDQKRYAQGLPYQFHTPELMNIFFRAIIFIKKLFGKKPVVHHV